MSDDQKAKRKTRNDYTIVTRIEYDYMNFLITPNSRYLLSNYSTQRASVLVVIGLAVLSNQTWEL